MNNIDRLGVRDVEGGAVLAVKVVPGSSRDAVAGLLGEALKVTTTAAPEKGKANAAVAKILAKALGIKAGQIRLISRASNPRKEFHITGMTAGQIRSRLLIYD